MAREDYSIKANTASPKNAVRRARSIYDRTEQLHRMEREYQGNPRVKYGGAARRAFDNVVEKALSSQGTVGRFMVDSIKAENAGWQATDNATFSGGNAVQRLYNMSRRGNTTARRLLYSRRRS